MCGVQVFDDSIELNVSSRDIVALRVKDKGKQLLDTGTISLLVEDLAMDEWERKTLKLPLHEHATLTVVVMKTSKDVKQPTTTATTDGAMNGVTDYTHEPVQSQSSAEFPTRTARRTLSPTNICGSIERFKKHAAGSDGNLLTHRRSRSAIGTDGAGLTPISIRRTSSADSVLADSTDSETSGATEHNSPRPAVSSDHERFIDTSLLETICGSVDDVSATASEPMKMLSVSHQSSLESTQGSTQSVNSISDSAQVRRDSGEKKKKSRNYYPNAQILDKVTGMKPLDKTASLLTSMTKNRFSIKTKTMKASSTPVGLEIEQSASYGD